MASDEMPKSGYYPRIAIIHANKSKSICEQSPLSKHLDSIKKRSPFDNGDKGLKR